jgi:hypothetical protein
MYTASCLCGGIAYEINGDLAPIQICHCSQCRKAQGTPFVTNIPVSTSAFRLLKGQELLNSFESSPGKRRYFCKVCGSPIYSARADTPEVMRIRAGSLEGDLQTRPAVHIYYESRTNWFDVNDDLPKLAGSYVAKKGS